jgi:hypothetical protein
MGGGPASCAVGGGETHSPPGHVPRAVPAAQPTYVVDHVGGGSGIVSAALEGVHDPPEAGAEMLMEVSPIPEQFPDNCVQVTRLRSPDAHICALLHPLPVQTFATGVPQMTVAGVAQVHGTHVTFAGGISEVPPVNAGALAAPHGEAPGFGSV